MQHFGEQLSPRRLTLVQAGDRVLDDAVSQPQAPHRFWLVDNQHRPLAQIAAIPNAGYTWLRLRTSAAKITGTAPLRTCLETMFFGKRLRLVIQFRRTTGQALYALGNRRMGREQIREVDASQQRRHDEQVRR